MQLPDSNRHREAMQLQQQEETLLGTCSRQKAAAERTPAINLIGKSKLSINRLILVIRN